MSNSNPRFSALRLSIWRLLSVVPALVLVLTACSTIATYDQAAYEHATSAKAETLLLMDRATTAYSQNTDKIDAVILDLNKAYEYDKGRARNQETVGMWTKMLSPDDLVGAFIRKWKSEGQLHPGYIKVKKKDVEDAFDQIIELEQGKQKTGT
jgi:hypothetical protein